ncbi:hypothetical protein TCDM_09687 [Trypanosoma cruzi Dm28c]|uniref:Uncharacterized protein n=1 Tax=Trypanosoma cruzi Dm28c TaxID=1416333 RepID=V5BDZ1_TRYCR|nr:hypothetical protein TCDM_09687 [Trypanosoma cruzi Dm28c]
MPRSFQHASLPAQVVLPALPLRRNVRHLSVKQLRVHHAPHNRRHATAAEHPQRHNVVPPLLHNHERNAQRVLAHVLHAPQPPADQVGRHALHLVVLVVLVADPHILSIHGLGAARGCRQEQLGWKKQMCGNNGHPHSLRHLHPPTQKGGVMGKRSPPHSARTKEYAAATPSNSHCNKEPCAHTHKRPQREGRGTSRSTALFFTSPFPDELALRPTLTVRHGAHQPLPSVCTQQAASSHQSATATGEHKH